MTREEAWRRTRGYLYDALSGEEADEIIKALEQEPKTGHWIYTLEDWNKWECSECGFTKRTDVHVSIGYKYCPKCGCKMQEE